MGASAIILFYEENSNGQRLFRKAVYHPLDGQPNVTGVFLADFLMDYTMYHAMRSGLNFDGMIQEYEESFRHERRRLFSMIYGDVSLPHSVEDEIQTKGIYMYDSVEQVPNADYQYEVLLKWHNSYTSLINGKYPNVFSSEYSTC
jgi:hypothetical protein